IARILRNQQRGRRTQAARADSRQTLGARSRPRRCAGGILLRMAARGRWPGWLNQAAKAVNLCVILVLNYSNASISLPSVARRPDIDFLMLILFLAIALCAVCFGAGWLVSRLFKADHSQQVSMTFGLGMSNNGAGLVVASATLADHPAVMLPLIFYTLI